MKHPETGEASEAAHGNSDSQEELAEVFRQRAAISAVLRAIANSPHDLQPIFDTIVDSAVHLCRADWGAFRLSEETGFRLVASKLSPGVSEMYPRPLLEHEVNQPIAAARNNVIAALNFLHGNPPDLQEVREALTAAVKDADRVGAIVGRMRALMQKVSPRSDPVDMNEALQEVIELTRGEALKNGVSVESQLAKGLPIIAGDRVQLQQVVLNLIINALQALGAATERTRQVIITTR